MVAGRDLARDPRPVTLESFDIEHGGLAIAPDTEEAGPLRDRPLPIDSEVAAEAALRSTRRLA